MTILANGANTYLEERGNSDGKGVGIWRKARYPTIVIVMEYIYLCSPCFLECEINVTLWKFHRREGPNAPFSWPCVSREVPFLWVLPGQ
jgi:hypothetical protein